MFAGFAITHVARSSRCMVRQAVLSTEVRKYGSGLAQLSAIQPWLQFSQISHDDLLGFRSGLHFCRVDLITLQYILHQRLASRNQQLAVQHAVIGFDDCFLCWSKARIGFDNLEEVNQADRLKKYLSRAGG